MLFIMAVCQYLLGHYSCGIFCLSFYSSNCKLWWWTISQ